MAIRTIDEINAKLQERFGETTDENDISFIEDINDTFADLESKTNGNELSELQNRYDELQQKYRDRFFGKGDNNDDDLKDFKKPPEHKKLNYEDLFKGE